MARMTSQKVAVPIFPSYRYAEAELDRSIDPQQTNTQSCGVTERKWQNREEGRAVSGAWRSIATCSSDRRRRESALELMMKPFSAMVGYKYDSRANFACMVCCQLRVLLAY